MNLPGPLTMQVIDAFAAGIYLLFGAIHLDLWLRHRERRSHLWLVAACGGALMVDLSGMAIRSAGPLRLLLLANLLGVVVATGSIVELVAVIGGRAPSRWIRGMQLASLVAAPVAAWVDPFGPVVYLLCFALLVIALVLAVRAGRGGDAESRTIAAGVLVLVVTLLSDVLMLFGIVPRVSGLPVLGFAVLFLMTARAINARHEREYRELGALRRELETRVLERTGELEQANLRLAEMSRTDALTGLANRRGFLEAAAQEIARAALSGTSWSIVMADLDHFKQINDSHGHAAGDAVLRTAAAVIRSCIRAQDLAGRWGGEEFILMLPQTGAAGAASAAETVRLAIASHPFSHDGLPLPLTLTLGVAEHRPEQSLDATIAAADRALYRAKEEGRNRVGMG